MNGEQSNSRFYEFDRETTQVVVQYPPLYEIYVNSLGLMHDMLCEFTDSLEKPQFTLAQIEQYMHQIDDQIMTDDIDHIPHGVLASRKKLGENLSINHNLAWTIRGRVERSETPSERFEAERSADQFLRSLIEAYTTLRILKRYREPVQLI